MHALRRGHATQRGVKYCAPGAGGLPANYLLNLVLNLTLNVLDLGKLVFRGSPFDSCRNQLYGFSLRLRNSYFRSNPRLAQLLVFADFALLCVVD